MKAASVVDTNDNPELEALFDSIVSGMPGASVGTAATIPQPANESAAGEDAGHDCAVINRVGKMTRALHEQLRELGYDRLLQDAAQAIPDARDRLSYIATMTEKAADRTLNAAEAAKPLQEGLGSDARTLSSRWRTLLDTRAGADALKDLVQDTCTFLDAVPEHAQATNAHLNEIILAQDFQDLTGQVIKRVTELARNLEGELLNLLLENAPGGKRPIMRQGTLNGPVVNAANSGDVVTSQAQVDELLDSLGF